MMFNSAPAHKGQLIEFLTMGAPTQSCLPRLVLRAIASRGAYPGASYANRAKVRKIQQCVPTSANCWVLITYGYDSTQRGCRFFEEPEQRNW